MKQSARDISTLARRAARGAGFPEDRAEIYGRAATLHLSTAQDPQPLIDALQDPADSAILRLPLVMQDVLRAVDIAGPDVTLSVHDRDAALVQSYIRLLPLSLSDCRVEMRPDAPARVHLKAGQAAPQTAKLPTELEAPEALLSRWKSLAKRSARPTAQPANGSSG